MELGPENGTTDEKFLYVVDLLQRFIAEIAIENDDLRDYIETLKAAGVPEEDLLPLSLEYIEKSKITDIKIDVIRALYTLVAKDRRNEE